MAIYFAFSDENGVYHANRNENFLSRHPFYVRCTVIINGDEWKKLNLLFVQLKKKYNLPVEKEIKWSYLWSLKKLKVSGKGISKKEKFYFLKDCDTHLLLKFIEESLDLLGHLSFAKIILTVTNNRDCARINESSFYKMHLQEVMQRVEMELRKEDESLCVLFMDSISERKDRLLREVYNSLFHEGDFVEYRHLKDSLNFEASDHSVGIQIADYIAGCFSSTLKGYKSGKGIFDSYVKCYVRTGAASSMLLGYGIREVPRNDTAREALRKLFGD